MTFAKVVCVIGIVISLIMGIATLRINILGAFIMLIVGILGSWIGSWTLYAFGQLVDDNEKIRICLSRVNEKLSTILSSQKNHH